MAQSEHGKITVAIDVGTTKICVIIAQLVDNHINVLGVGKAHSDGLEKGVVVDIPRTVKSIKLAVQEAELVADVKVQEACIGISGSHIHSFNSQGAVAIKKSRVSQQDITNVMDAARAVPIGEGYQVLHTLAQYFTIDARERLQDPQGMHGTRLEVNAHIIVGAVTAVQNLIKCCELAGIHVTDVILEQLASADAVLSNDERQLGSGIIDIGGGTSDFALYKDSNIRHSIVLPVAGNHVTRDVAVGLRTTLRNAEVIKKLYGVACKELLGEDMPLEIETMEGNAKRIVLASELVAIIEPRIYELLMLIYSDVKRQGLLPYMSGGLVITGGGSLLRGIDTVARTIFGVPTRIGYPHIQHDVPQHLNNPIYATGYGLLVYALKHAQKSCAEFPGASWSQRITHRMRSWISDFF